MRTFVCVGLCLFVAVGSKCLAQTKPRVFISTSNSWEVSGSGGGSSDIWGAHSQGGARPQTAETIKTFSQKCPNVLITSKSDKADYAVTLEHEGGKGWGRRDNKIAVFNREGDLVFSSSTVTLGGAVEGACSAINFKWRRNVLPSNTPPREPATPPTEELAPQIPTDAGSYSSDPGNQARSFSPSSTADRSGVAVQMTRTAKHEKYSTPQVAFAIVDDVHTYLKSKNVILARSDDAASYQLRLIVDRPITKWMEVTIRAYDWRGQLLWEDKASSGSWKMTGAGGLEVTTRSIHSILDRRLGSETGLPVRETTPPDQ